MYTIEETKEKINKISDKLTEILFDYCDVMTEYYNHYREMKVMPLCDLDKHLSMASKISKLGLDLEYDIRQPILKAVDRLIEQRLKEKEEK